MTEESWGTTIDTRIAILSEAVRLAEAMEMELQALGEAVQVRGTVPEGETTLVR